MTLREIFDSLFIWLETDFVYFLKVLFWRVNWMDAHWIAVLFSLLTTIFVFSYLLQVIGYCLGGTIDSIMKLKTDEAYREKRKMEAIGYLFTLGVIAVIFTLVNFIF